METKIPWHIWIIGAFVLFIYSIGAYDFFMVNVGNLDYLKSINTNGDLVAYFKDYPLALTMLWMINIITGIVASILLLLRSRWAVWVALVSMLSIFCLEVLTFGFKDRWSIFGPLTSIIDVTILAITIGFYSYCCLLANREVLK